MESNWEHDWRPELWSISGPQNDSEIGPLRPIFNTPLKVAQIDMLTTNQWKMFENITKDRNYDLFWDPKWPKNWASEVHILHIS